MVSPVRVPIRPASRHLHHYERRVFLRRHDEQYTQPPAVKTAPHERVSRVWAVLVP